MLALCAVAALGCGGSGEATASEPAAEEAAGAEMTEPEVPEAAPPKQSAIELLGISAPDKPWADMSYEEREWYMVGKVHPIMREVFTNFNERYAKFECAPCHGEDGMQKKYKMPSDHLSPIPDFDSEDFQAMAQSKMVTFMRDEVTPTTAKLLGLTPYDPSTGEGFSCYDCHLEAE